MTKKTRNNCLFLRFYLAVSEKSLIFVGKNEERS